jgi:hypothetical protein
VKARRVENAVDWEAFDDELSRAAEARAVMPALQPAQGAEPQWAVDTAGGFRQARVQLQRRRWQADLKSSLLLPRGTGMPTSSAVQGVQVRPRFLGFLDSNASCREL